MLLLCYTQYEHYPKLGFDKGNISFSLINRVALRTVTNFIVLL